MQLYLENSERKSTNEMLKEKTLLKHNEVHSRGINKKVGSMEKHYFVASYSANF
jgi:hypothetical protein